MDELPADVDSTRHARYWLEAFNGVVLRMGLLVSRPRRSGVAGRCRHISADSDVIDFNEWTKSEIDTLHRRGTRR